MVLMGGYAWSFHFPIIKNIWTSSFVLVAGGYSLFLLGIAQLVVVGWKTAGPVNALVWLGANAITLYMINNFIGISQLATRAVGGDISSYLDTQFSPGAGRLAVCVDLLPVDAPDFG
jgi:predicted acyltransferase